MHVPCMMIRRLAPTKLLVQHPLHIPIAVKHQARNAISLSFNKLVGDARLFNQPSHSGVGVPQLNVVRLPLGRLRSRQRQELVNSVLDILIAAVFVLHNQPQDMHGVAFRLLQSTIVSPRPHRPHPLPALPDNSSPNRRCLSKNVLGHEVLAHQVPQDSINIRQQRHPRLAPLGLFRQPRPQQLLVDVAQLRQLVVSHRLRLAALLLPLGPGLRRERQVRALVRVPALLRVELLANVGEEHGEGDLAVPDVAPLLALGHAGALPAAEARAEQAHHGGGVALAAVLGLGEDGGDAVGDGLGDGAVGLRGEGALADALARGEDGAGVGRQRGVGQDPLGDAAVAAHGHGGEVLLAAEVLVQLEGGAPFLVRRGPDAEPLGVRGRGEDEVGLLRRAHGAYLSARGLLSLVLLFLANWVPLLVSCFDGRVGMWERQSHGIVEAPEVGGKDKAQSLSRHLGTFLSGRGAPPKTIAAMAGKTQRNPRIETGPIQASTWHKVQAALQGEGPRGGGGPSDTGRRNVARFGRRRRDIAGPSAAPARIRDTKKRGFGRDEYGKGTLTRPSHQPGGRVKVSRPTRT
ncbi:hypothetical protein CCHR01_00878 [Colletotrichum chrysophilum]|uniref:Uncharacterized protein n=1 Tax=Colletotrichum chrysophilum TaxID=1836956 RepID=A0AAD9ELR7_9PEZI|nr:hypothetical protein CCHR01_00878 [Colletotrichum chrysophilum]